MSLTLGGMMTPRHLWIGGIVACISPIQATAQACTGSAPFTAGSLQLGASAAFDDDMKTFGGGLAYGGTGAFGQVAVATTTFDGLDGSMFTVGAAAGYQFKLDDRSFAHLCPIASAAFGSGPNDVDLFGDGSFVPDLSETDLAIGLSLGVMAASVGETQVIPTASLSFINATVEVEDQVSGISDSESESFGQLGLGIGFIVGRTLTLQPGITIPFGLEGASTSFTAGVALNFGKPAQ